MAKIERRGRNGNQVVSARVTFQAKAFLLFLADLMPFQISYRLPTIRY